MLFRKMTYLLLRGDPLSVKWNFFSVLEIHKVPYRLFSADA